MKEAGRAVGPLRLVFWSAPFLVATWTADSMAGLALMFAADIIGTALLAGAAFRLGGIKTGRPFRILTRCATCILAVKLAVVLLLAVPMVSFRTWRGVWGHLVFYPLQATCLTAVVLLCVGMRGLCRELELPVAVGHWTTAIYLAGIFLVVPALFRILTFVLILWVWRSGIPLGYFLVASLYVPAPLAAVAAASIMHSTRNTIRTIMLFRREEKKEEGSGEGQEGSSQ